MVSDLLIRDMREQDLTQVLVVEEAIRGIDGVKEVSATAREGAGTVNAELLEDADQQRVYQDIKQEIDRVRTFPEDAEEPEVTLATRRREVLNIAVYEFPGTRETE